MDTVDQSLFEPKSAGQLIASGLRNCFANGGGAFITAAAVLLPAVILTAFGSYVAAELGVLDLQAQAQAGNINPASIDLRAIVLNGAYQLGAGLVMALCGYMALAGAARVTAERALGKETGPMAAWDFLVGELGKMIGGTIAMLLVVIAAMLVVSVPVVLLSAGAAMKAGGQGGQATSLQVIIGALYAIPMLIMSVYIASMPSVSAVEHRGAFGTLGRSFGLVTGNFGRILLTMLLAMLFTLGPAMATGLLMQKLAMPPLRESLGDSMGALVSGLPGSVAMLLLMPILYSIQAMIYFDLRSRRSDEDFSPADLAFDIGYDLPGAPPQAPMAGGTTWDASPAGEASVEPESEP